MRLSIRAEQMSAIELETQERFVQRISAHLLEKYPGALVTLPGGEQMTVDTLPKEILSDLVRTGIARARSLEMTFESSIAAFTALMFEIAPNFYTNRICQVVFNDEGAEPNERVDLLLTMMSEKSVETMRADYDPAAWKIEEATENTDQTPETAAPNTDQAEPANLDFLETVKM